MFKKILILLSITFVLEAYAAPLEIITSISPLASLTAMIAKDKANIVSMCKSNQCPHHYFIKPNQLMHLKKADLIIYIDESFEIFIQNALKASKAKELKLSANPILVSKVNGRTNWHLWLNKENIKAILDYITVTLVQMDPQNKDFYKQNHQQALLKVSDLERKMYSQLKDLPRPVLLDDSLSYFFTNFKTNEQLANFGNEKITPQIVKKIRKEAKNSNSKCIFISSHQEKEKLERLFGSKITIVSINTEAFSDKGNLSELLEIEIQKTIDLVTDCI